LLALREYQDEKADIILKYTSDEARLLKSYGELPDNLNINEVDMDGEQEEGNFKELIELTLRRYSR
jgi:translation initiation factor 1A